MTQAERDRIVALKKAKKKLNYAKGGSEGTGHHRAARATAAARTEAAWRQGRGARVAGHALQSDYPSGDQVGDNQDPVAAGIRGIWTDAGVGVLGEEAQNRGEPEDGAAVDGGGQVVASAEAAGEEDS